LLTTSARRVGVVSKKCRRGNGGGFNFIEEI
jgi:hypothetical protein